MPNGPERRVDPGGDPLARSPGASLGYHFLAAPALAGGLGPVAFGMWLAGFLYALVYTYAWTLSRAVPARPRPVGRGRPGTFRR